MSTCKDCIHAEVCPDKDNVVRPCYFFKDRSKFIEPPIRIGDTVWMWDYKKEIYSSKVKRIMMDCRGLMFDADVLFRDSHIGDRIFLSKEEAEKALKEQSDD